tara:strand:- start:332 stop:502 length:171 start_codon:yes stop_codon:yes gene_type:complete
VGCRNQTSGEYQRIPRYKGDEGTYEQPGSGEYKTENSGVEKNWTDCIEPADDIVRD